MKRTKTITRERERKTERERGRESEAEREREKIFVLRKFCAPRYCVRVSLTGPCLRLVFACVSSVQFSTEGTEVKSASVTQTEVELYTLQMHCSEFCRGLINLNKKQGRFLP
jgi:hypothetical protein